jgi:hypothetical protein
VTKKIKRLEELLAEPEVEDLCKWSKIIKISLEEKATCRLHAITSENRFLGEFDQRSETKRATPDVQHEIHDTLSLVTFDEDDYVTFPSQIIFTYVISVKRRKGSEVWHTRVPIFCLELINAVVLRGEGR